jgi:D-3-phosphoglycerate dehydrogenase
METTYKILVADPISEKGIEDLRSDPALSVDVKLGLSEDELVSIVSQYTGIVVRSQTQITARVLEAATHLKAVGRAGVGVDNIDTDAASRRGVVVMNTPGGNTISTAEHAFTLMMSLARHIPQAHISVTSGKFKEGRKKYQGVELNGKTLAILGMGRIGTEFAKRARAFNMRIVAYDPYLAESKASALGVELAKTVDDAIQEADFITLHMPKTDETTHLINASRLNSMKRGVRIINCARGGLIDEEALLAALESGQVAGAALDVFEVEPPANDYALLNRENVVFTPHLGASTAEAQETVGIEIAKQVRDAVVDGTIVNAVNMPNIDERTLKQVGAYLALAEAMGCLVARTTPAHPEVLRIQYSGKVAKLDTTLITRYALKGFLQVASGQDTVNPVNAPAFAENLGLRVTETRLAEPTDYTDLIEMSSGNDGQSVTVAGTFFGKEPRIVRLRDRKINVVPKGHLLLLENTDIPGIVGSVGRVLGENNVNIANMSLGRNERGGQALMVLNLDSAPGPELKAKLEALEGIIEAKLVSL